MKPEEIKQAEELLANIHPTEKEVEEMSEHDWERNVYPIRIYELACKQKDEEFLRKIDEFIKEKFSEIKEYQEYPDAYMQGLQDGVIMLSQFINLELKKSIEGEKRE